MEDAIAPNVEDDIWKCRARDRKRQGFVCAYDDRSNGIVM
jgi:hypothetical protein